jgi:RNA polymerase sigma-70 factor (ECF subfamily)
LAHDDLTPAVAAARLGDEAAFRVLYRAVQPGLLRYLSVMVGAEAEDVAAETWLQVVRDLHGFEGDGDGFRRWVITIGRHRGLDHVRRQQRRPAAPTPTEILTEYARSGDVAADALESLTTEYALRMIRRLPPDQAEAVLLRVVVGLDAAAAADVLHKRPGAVRTAAYRGLRRLAELMGSDTGGAFGAHVTGGGGQDQ